MEWAGGTTFSSTTVVVNGVQTQLTNGVNVPGDFCCKALKQLSFPSLLESCVTWFKVNPISRFSHHREEGEVPVCC
jgi:hypothetical protein